MTTTSSQLPPTALPKQSSRRTRLRLKYILPCFIFISSTLSILQGNFIQPKGISHAQHQRRSLLEATIVSGVKCIPSGITSFPGDFFTQEERLHGGIVIHLILIFYICSMIAVVCDNYFVPALEIICDKLKLPADVAGATFMAIGASSPELFSAIIGSFVTEGDIGIGTVIGSAVFNILGITGVVGVILWKQVLPIERYPLIRDCIAYGVTVFCLILIISDNIVTWWESTSLLVVFFLYLLLMYFNSEVEKCSKMMVKRMKSTSCCCCCCCDQNEEKIPIMSNKVFEPEILESQKKDKSKSESYTVEVVESSKERELQNSSSFHRHDESLSIEEEDVGGTICSPPSGGPWSYVWWILLYPATFLFFITIPKGSERTFRKIFPLTFITSITWIGGLSYLAVWMVTIIGFTFSIPESVSGLTILAAGTSIPDLISTVIVAKNGFGNMAVSNLVGSNTFDISICLGIPWLAKTLLTEQGYLRIYSSALTFATATLFITLITFFLIFQFSGWKLNR
ncbi:Sodium/potassium/calcium exchanger 5, partial [Stegodyphus mimosarum]